MDDTFCKICNLKANVFQKLNEGEVDILVNNCTEVQFEPGDIIIKQDAFSTNVTYIKSGLAKVHMKGPNREKIMKIVKGPSYLCLPSTFGDNVNHFSATAIEKTKVCFIDVTTFKNFIYENGEFAYQIILDMSKGELKNFHLCINNAQQQNMGRIADAILFFAKEIYDSNSFILPVSRQDLADLTGITRESTSRILTDFHKERILEIEGRKISIVNEVLLRQICEKG